MRIIANNITLCLVLAFFVGPAGALAQTPEVLSTQPVHNELDVVAGTDISVTFDRDMQAGTINSSSFVVNASSTGLHQGTITYDPGTKTATFDPDVDFAEGEVVSVVLTENIISSQGAPLTDSYCWSFTIEAGQCSGTYTDGPVYLLGNDTLHWLCDMDLDNDTDIDLVVPKCGTWANPGSKIAVLINKGDGSFEDHVDYDVASYPVSAVSADLNGDGYPDVTSANWFARNVSVLFGDGSGGFVSRVDYPVGHSPNEMGIADLNGDGHIDIMTASRLYSNVSVLLNNGDGTFGSWTHFPVGAMTLQVVPGDFDGDGDFDLATGNLYTTTVSILMNDGDGAFGPPVLYSGGGLHPATIRTADFNQDGHLDIVAANLGSDNVSMLLNNGDGTFTLDALYSTPALPNAVEVGDLDGDGDPDVITTSRTTHRASILINDGNGILAAPVNYPVGDAPRGIVASDLNGNGSLDLAIASIGSRTVSILWNFCGAGYTPPGSDVTVDLGDSLSITFDEVISSGVTEVTTSTQGPPPPTGFKLVPSAPPVYYEITTTAVYSGNITICFTYDEADLKGPEENLRIFHRTGDPAVWENATLSVDEVNNQICGIVTSLSPFVLAEVVVPVTLDIKPGSCPNPLNVRPVRPDIWVWDDETPTVAKIRPDSPQRYNPVLPVAILGTAEFDVADIDSANVTLEGIAALRWNIEDVSTPVDEEAEECECNSLGADGYDDLTLKFDKSLIVEALGEVYDGDTIPLTITGELTDGTPFEGTDCVVILGDAPPDAGASPSGESLEVVLLGNFPNPFNPTTEISFSLPAASRVKLEIFNVMGQKVATLVDGRLEAGEHIVQWDGSEAASGVYLYRLQADDFVDTKKMILLK